MNSITYILRYNQIPYKETSKDITFKDICIYSKYWRYDLNYHEFMKRYKFLGHTLIVLEMGLNKDNNE